MRIPTRMLRKGSREMVLTPDQITQLLRVIGLGHVCMQSFTLTVPPGCSATIEFDHYVRETADVAEIARA